MEVYVGVMILDLSIIELATLGAPGFKYWLGAPQECSKMIWTP